MIEIALAILSACHLFIGEQYNSLTATFIGTVLYLLIIAEYIGGIL